MMKKIFSSTLKEDWIIFQCFHRKYYKILFYEKAIKEHVALEYWIKHATEMDQVINNEDTMLLFWIFW